MDEQNSISQKSHSQKRAQSGLEYLTTYGWTLLILVIITAILWFMGAFNSLQFAGPGIVSGGFFSFTHVDHKVTQNSAVLLFVNSVSREVTVNTATVGVLDDVADTACNSGLPVVLTPNGNFTITCTSLPQGGIAQSGNPYTFSVNILFTDSVSGNSHTEIGFIKGKVE
ncbi:hypothetical protein HY989_02245 [Candidatus Micrarchaeota archaeon]|nr:hypothetical protein [Candidatus Micrarchaeota archaeon]